MDKPFGASRETLDLGSGRLIEPGFIDTSTRYTASPLVFLNSCSSGAANPLSFTRFQQKFREKGAVGLVATFFPVPILFAAAFGQELLRRYVIDDFALGETLWQLRRELLNKNNPLGMIYSLQCPLDLRAPKPTLELAA